MPIADSAAHGIGVGRLLADARAEHVPRSTTATRRLLGDAVALIALVHGLWLLADHDGGFERPAAATFALVLAVAAAACWRETTRLDRPTLLTLALWVSGHALGLAFALDRTNAVPSLVGAGTVAMGFLLTRRLLRRRHGPGLLLAVLGTALGLYAARALLQWWGTAMSGGDPLWLVLSNHNASGALTGGLGLLLLGTATTARRPLPIALSSMAAGVGLAGVLLSTSRGAAVTTTVGLVVLVAIALRAVGPRRITVGLLASATACTAVVLLCSALVGADAAPSRRAVDDAGAAAHVALRLEHAEAGVELWARRPLLGTGPGSYRNLAIEHTDGRANLTSHSHSQPVEVLVEAGVMGGLAVVTAHVGVVLALAALLRRSRTTEPDGSGVDDHLAERPRDGRLGLGVGAAGAVVHLALHQAIDIDGDFPVLALLLGLSTAVVLSSRAHPRRDRPSRTGGTRAPSMGVAVTLCVLLALAGAAGRQELAAARADESVAWDADVAVSRARTLVDAGDVAAADAVVRTARRWSPGHPALDSLRGELDHRTGGVDADVSAARLRPMPTVPVGHLGLARALLDDGDLDVAGAILDDLLAGLDAHPGFGMVTTEQLARDLAAEVASARRTAGSTTPGQ